MDKRKTIAEMMIGEKIEGYFILESFSSNNKSCTLKDSTGEAVGDVAFDFTESEIVPLIKSVVKATLVVKPGKDGIKAVSVKAIAKADRSEYKSSDFFNSLSAEVIEAYKDSIRSNLRFVKDAGLKALLDSVFTGEMLDTLASYPATVCGFATYSGGALAVTANLLEQVKVIGVSYVKLSNKLHADNINWSLVMTAAALHLVAVSDAYTNEEPFVKTALAIERGYGSLLQRKLDRIIASASIELSEETYSKLLNCLWCVGEQHARISPTSKEGILLQQAYRTYSRLDNFDLYKADNLEESESGYSYSSSNRMYVDTREVQRPVSNAS